MIKRVYVKRKQSSQLRAEILDVLGIDVPVTRYLRYDVEGLTEDEFNRVLPEVFYTPPSDDLFLEQMPKAKGFVFGVEFLPGQFDMRADSAAQCVQLITMSTRPLIACADIYDIENATDSQIKRIKEYLINPVDSRECSLDKPETLEMVIPPPAPVEMLKDFGKKPLAMLKAFHKESGFAMSVEDLVFVQSYFRSERRDPTMTELKVIDTYWSDHCRHTTFLTALEFKLKTENPHLESTLNDYLKAFNKLYEGRADKYVSLMDMATIGAKILTLAGATHDIDVSPEINACTIKTSPIVDGMKEDWLVLFKNETHNHPTEIEPYGGAATCLGGAIRDPLSGRSYVYQSMRITGAGDINAPISDTVKGKLPQRVISRTASKGFSSYGNQIGIATGKVREYYHSGYVAKRLETGFVVGAAPEVNVRRYVPDAGDVVLLIGGATGRDGCGGATGSSKSHDLHSIETCGAEVQKGNPAIERKLQRLFRNHDATRLIKRCNDFGAGGVSVAIGELASGLDIDLDSVPKKYSGLSATELAISESQERMAVVIAPDDVSEFVKICDKENLDATVVAKVTDTDSMRMFYNGTLIVDLKRKFLDSNGVRQNATAALRDGKVDSFDNLNSKRKGYFAKRDYAALATDILSDYNVASQKGMGEAYDSTIGALSVLMPFGGKNQLTPCQAMAAKLPAHTDACTVSSWGFNPYLMEKSPYVGALYSVICAVERIVATGVNPRDAYLTMQEFFARCTDANKWGAPASALLGALEAQLRLGVPAIGGKDSMSGSFERLDVPNTLIAFALGMSEGKYVVSNVFNRTGQRVYRYRLKRDEFSQPDFAELNGFLDLLSGEIRRGNVDYTAVTEEGGAFAQVAKSCFGNMIGFAFSADDEDVFSDSFGDILVAPTNVENFEGYGLELIGVTVDAPNLIFDARLQPLDDGSCVVFDGRELPLEVALKAFTGTFESVYPTTAPSNETPTSINYVAEPAAKPKKKSKSKSAVIAVPRVIIPVFAGTNCEYESAYKFELAGADVNTMVIRNRTGSQVNESVQALAEQIASSQILMIPGGFSGGDEPDGSAKLIAAFLSSPRIKDALDDLIYKRKGLVLGICNGFQALIRLGLLPDGKISPLNEQSPQLTFNNIGRHMSSIVNIRVASNLSPWYNAVKTGDVYSVVISHGEGKFVAPDAVIKRLIDNGQVATQYCDSQGNVRPEMPYNPNGSMMNIEGITNADGRILGKMGHSERMGANLYKNYSGADFDMQIFESGIKYFK